ncbi:MAG: MBL fold metallo-hydrolase [Verrucomicrobiae bacterium]|nr:MBL fold metallo-hydrolase [Verrucomicrobiae bacterium]
MVSIPLPLPLEDSWSDVLGKAMRGAGLDPAKLASMTGLAATRLDAILSGEKPEENVLRTLAAALGLRPGPFVELAGGRVHPGPLDAARWPDVHQIPSRYGDMIVNAWLLGDPASREAIFFDAGADADAARDTAAAHRLAPSLLCVTHTHGDHIEALPELVRAFHLRVVAPKGEPLEDALLAEEGAEFAVGALRARAQLTDGHSRGHLAWVVTGHPAWPGPVVAVGDAIFAGSMGGGQISYARLREHLHRKLLALPSETLLCPGHGPATTVAQELKHNPFA